MHYLIISLWKNRKIKNISNELLHKSLFPKGFLFSQILIIDIGHLYQQTWNKS